MIPTMDLSVSSDLSGSVCNVERNPNRTCIYGASEAATHQRHTNSVYVPFPAPFNPRMIPEYASRIPSFKESI
jgi:hypothetical protein